MNLSLGAEDGLYKRGGSVVEDEQARLYSVNIVKKALNIVQHRITIFFTWMKVTQHSPHTFVPAMVSYSQHNHELRMCSRLYSDHPVVKSPYPSSQHDSHNDGREHIRPAKYDGVKRPRLFFLELHDRDNYGPWQ